MPQFSNLLNSADSISSKNNNTSNVEALPDNENARLEERVGLEDDDLNETTNKPVFSINLNENSEMFTANTTVNNTHTRESSLPIAANITDDEKYQQISSVINPKQSQNNGFGFNFFLP